MYKEIINTSHKLSTKKYNKDMGNPKAFLTIPRQEAGYRPIHDRISDYSEVEPVSYTHLTLPTILRV